MKKFGILVISYDDPLYKAMDAMRLKVFSKRNIPIYFAYNGVGTAYCNKESMYVANNNMNPTMYNKLVIASDYLLKNEWADVDYIVRANSSTFLNPDILDEQIQLLPNENCFAGSDLRGTLISGMFMVFSKDVVRKIISSGTIPGHHHLNRYYDDEGICMQMRDWGIPRTIMPTPIFLDNIATPDQAKQLKYDALVQSMGHRIRNDHNRNDIDLYIWTQLTEAYLKN